MQLDNAAGTAAVSPDGRLAAVAGGSTNAIVLWEMETGKVVQRLEGAGRPVWSVAAQAKGRGYAFGQTFESERDNRRGPLERSIGLGEFRVTGGKLPESEFVRGTATAANQRLETKAGSAEPWSILRVMQGDVEKFAFERDSTSGYDHRSYTFLPNGGPIASGGSNGDLRLYSLTLGSEHRELRGHTSAVWAVAAAPDGKTLISGSADQTVRLWDLPSGNPLLTLFYGSDGEWVAWTPQGYYTASAAGEKYIGWHVNQGADKLAKYYSAGQLKSLFHRSDVVDEFLELRDIDLAVRVANNKRQMPQTRPLGPADVTANEPPQIFLESLGGEAASQRVRVKGEVRTTGTLRSFRLYRNNHEVGRDALGRLQQASAGRHPFDLEILLEEGDNAITAVAAHDKGDPSQETRVVRFQPARVSVLAVGLNLAGLRYADQDATAFAKLFPGAHPRPVLNDQATQARILTDLLAFRKGAAARDILLVFLSGHGDVANGEYYFFGHGHNEEMYSLADVRGRDILNELGRHTGPAIVFLDTCRAAAAGRKSIKSQEDALDELQREPNVVILASSSANDPSVELDEYRHGAFTQALLEAFGGAADSDKNGTITLNELPGWVDKRLRALTKDKQQLKVIGNAARPLPLLRLGGAK